MINPENNNKLEQVLKAFDDEVDLKLILAYAEIEQKSKALANSLKRCFDSARSSQRFEKAFELGLQNKFTNLDSEFKEQILQNILKEYEEIDFMIFREFVRLLRACSLHISGNISGQIREQYNKTFKETRLKLAFECGVNS